MISRLSRRVYPCAFAIAMIAGPSLSASAADATVKVAFWNIMSGKGVDALAGRAAPFRNVPNCTDPSQPLNAWGVGASQVELLKVASDPSVVALGLAESWGNVCGSPENVRQALGWKARTSEQNGVALVARYGVAGPEQWQQLDTTLNTSPGDTMWVLRVPVCLDAACSQSMPVYVAHWYGTGANGATSYARQAQQTVSFLNATANGLPHILVGDLNVWEGAAAVCNQNPTNGALPYLRNAGYRDAWMTVQGANEGHTGMANRAGCGYPEGNTWKRIDYAWTLPAFEPSDIQRFAVTAAGEASPSDHYGIVVSLPNPYPASVPAPAPAPAPTPALAPAPEPAPAPAIWASLVKASANGSMLQKTSGCGECFDAGAIGTTPVTAGGSVIFTVSAGHRLFVGLGSDTTASTSYAIDFAFSFWPNGTWEVREKNVYKTEGSFTAADQFEVAVEDTAVKYYKNGSLVYTSQVPVTSPLVVDASLATVGAAVQNLTVPATTTTTTTTAPAPAPASNAVIWTSLVKTVAAGSALTKAAGCAGCFDAGAVSQQQIGATGSVSFTPAAGHRQIVGLGRDTTASTSYAIDYGFSFWEGGTFEIREANLYRDEGTYCATDVFKVAVEAGVVKYYKNDALVYTSKVIATGPLVVDTSMSSVGATVSNVIVK